MSLLRVIADLIRSCYGSSRYYRRSTYMFFFQNVTSLDSQPDFTSMVVVLKIR